jgi:hypothetical protein
LTRREKIKPYHLATLSSSFLSHSPTTTTHHLHQSAVNMASEDRQTQARIRRALGINSYDLTALERYLLKKGYVPDSTDEQASRDAVFKLRKLCDQDLHAYPLNSPGISMRGLFSASPGIRDHAEVVESESSKYDAFLDLFLMLAVRKAEAQESQVTEAAVKVEQA